MTVYIIALKCDGIRYKVSGCISPTHILHHACPAFEDRWGLLEVSRIVCFDMVSFLRHTSSLSQGSPPTL